MCEFFFLKKGLKENLCTISLVTVCNRTRELLKEWERIKWFWKECCWELIHLVSTEWNIHRGLAYRAEQLIWFENQTDVLLTDLHYEVFLNSFVSGYYKELLFTTSMCVLITCAKIKESYREFSYSIFLLFNCRGWNEIELPQDYHTTVLVWFIQSVFNAGSRCHCLWKNFSGSTEDCFLGKILSGFVSLRWNSPKHDE